jgi:hypothetical protein
VSKQQAGPRFDAEVYDKLKRLAAAASTSISNYIERVMIGHITKQQNGGDDINLDETLVRLERRIGEQHERQQRNFQSDIKRLEKGLYAVRVMIEALAHATPPDNYARYRKELEGLLQAAGIQITQGNGTSHE